MSRLVASFLAFLLAVLPSTAQQQSRADNLIIPAGTALSLVLMQQISSSATHGGDQVHLQLVSPVVSGSKVAIPAGTFLQGTVNRISQHNDFVSLSLYAASLAFANGYVEKLSGPIELRSAEGWWRPAPNSHHGAALIPLLLAPGIGAGIGTAVGKDAVLTPGSIVGGQLIPGSVTPSTRGRDALIGFTAGAAVMALGVAIYVAHHHHGAPDFFFPAGAPMEVILASPVSLDATRATNAVVQPQAIHPDALPPQPRPPAEADSLPTQSGTCFAPDTPATPDLIIPGIPATADSPGTPDTIIPGRPAIPGAVIPCP